MKKTNLKMLALFFLLPLSNVMAQNTPDLSGTSSIKSGDVQVNHAVVVLEPSKTNFDETTDGKIPSSMQFLVPLCEEKDGYYYLPKSNFLELTQQQQDYLLTQKSKFIIKEDK